LETAEKRGDIIIGPAKEMTKKKKNLKTVTGPPQENKKQSRKSTCGKK